ncbi:T9SS type A sorting domain-containing protein [bacterium]|nr:T9SS type A sorting domain-containing protein [bacterium]
MKNSTLAGLVFILVVHVLGARNPPETWISKGIGGGGALFCPVFSPHEPGGFYMSCDMGELFHTRDLGVHWDQVPFQEVATGNQSQLHFTRDPDVLYVLQYLGWGYMPAKSEDGGKTWRTLHAFPEDREAFYMASDHDNPDRIVVTTWSTLYFSGDGGQSFAERFCTDDEAGIHMAGSYFNQDELMIGTNLGLLISDDGGLTFELESLPGIPDGWGMISFDAAGSGDKVRFWCTAAAKADLWGGITGADAWNLCRGIYSLDAGAASWINRTGNADLEHDFPFFIACAEQNPELVFVAGENDSGMPVVMKTVNGGIDWSHVFLTDNNENIITGWQGHQGDVDFWWGEFAEGFTASGPEGDTLAMTDLGFVHMSTDGGGTWVQKYVNPSYQNPMGAPTPKKKSYQGAFNQTSLWQIYWHDASNLFACFTDIRGIRSTDGGETWSFDYTGHNLNTMYRIVRHPDNGAIYAATASVHDLYMSQGLRDNPTDGGEGRVLYSMNGGADWHTLHDFGRNVIWVETDPDRPERLYAAVVHSTEGGLYRTTNLGSGPSCTWQKLAVPPRTEGHPKMIRVLNDGTLVASYSGRISSGFTASSGIFVSLDDGETWEDRSDPGMRYWTQDVVVYPFDPEQNTWYACVFSGWGGPPNGLGGLYRTTDRGISWNRISEIDRVHSCTFHPDDPDCIFVTSEADGLWFSKNVRDERPDFTQVASYAFAFPGRVYFNPYDHEEVWVASFGNGMHAGRMESENSVRFSGSAPGPVHFRLHAFPNPFNPDVQIGFQVPKSGHVRLEVFNILGQRICILADERFTRGSYSVSWDGTDQNRKQMPPGAYLCRLMVDGKIRKTEKLIFKP